MTPQQTCQEMTDHQTSRAKREDQSDNRVTGGNPEGAAFKINKILKRLQACGRRFPGQMRLILCEIQ